MRGPRLSSPAPVYARAHAHMHVHARMHTSTHKRMPPPPALQIERVGGSNLAFTTREQMTYTMDCLKVAPQGVCSRVGWAAISLRPALPCMRKQQPSACLSHAL